jgi:hypothetical protein
MAESSDDARIEGRDARREADIEEIREHLLGVNDALFGLAGILCRIIVDGGLVTREDLAAMILARAGGEDDPDHRPAMVAFARSIRMNLPGGRFDVIEGGGSEVDPSAT